MNKYLDVGKCLRNENWDWPGQTVGRWAVIVIAYVCLCRVSLYLVLNSTHDTTRRSSRYSNRSVPAVLLLVNLNVLIALNTPLTPASSHQLHTTATSYRAAWNERTRNDYHRTASLLIASDHRLRT